MTHILRHKLWHTKRHDNIEKARTDESESTKAQNDAIQSRLEAERKADYFKLLSATQPPSSDSDSEKSGSIPASDIDNETYVTDDSMLALKTTKYGRPKFSTDSNVDLGTSTSIQPKTLKQRQNSSSSTKSSKSVLDRLDPLSQLSSTKNLHTPLLPPKSMRQKRKRKENLNHPIIYSAISSYTPSSPSDMALTRGELYQVVAKHPSGWWIVRPVNNPKIEGLAPKTFFQKK